MALALLASRFGSSFGKPPDTSNAAFFSYYGVEELAVDKPLPPMTLPSLPPLEYNPITDEYSWVDNEDPRNPVGASILAGFFGTIIVVQALRTALLAKRKGWLRNLLTYQMSETGAAVHSFRKLRDAFTSVPVPAPKPYENHSHGYSAGARAAALSFMNAVCVALGMDRYSYQMSSSEQKRGVAGERTYFWAKDTAAEPCFDPLTDASIVTLVDVDYYLDMPTFLAETARPTMLYTIVPETAGRIREDYAYNFDKHQRINWSVTGGAKYQHRLWNYGSDGFVTALTFLGIPYKTVIYDVQSQRTSPDRAVVLLSPMRTYYGVLAPIVYYMGRHLDYLKTSVKSFSKVVTHAREGKFVSVAPHDSETSATVPVKIFDALVSQKRNSPKGELNNYSVKSYLDKEEITERDLISPILTSYFNTAEDMPLDAVFVTDIPRMVRVAFGTPDPADKPKLVAFAAPFGVPPAFVPMNNAAGSEQSIAGRVVLPQETVAELLGETKMRPFMSEVLGELLGFLVPVPHQGVPYDFDAIAELQVRSGQKQDLAKASTLGAALSRIVTTFMKGEATEKPTDPRNITTFNAPTKIDYASFIYPLTEVVFKSMPWYAFAKSPRVVAERVAAICKNNDSVVCPDFSRMDGHINELCRVAERALGRRFFAPRYHDAWDESHGKAYNNTGVTEHGVRYDQGYSRGSGEMGTSAFNTFINLLVCYYTLRCNGLNKDAAWKTILDNAILGGDDGLFGKVSPEQIIKGGRAWGFIIKSPEYHRKDKKFGVNFLARIYGPHVWEGDPTSICSPRRQLSKFHLTTSVPLSDSEKLREKALSFALTDSNTPIFSQLTKAVAKVLPSKEISGHMQRWGDQHDLAEQYPNAYADWMLDAVMDQLPLTDVKNLITWLESCPPVDELLNAPVFYDTGSEYTYNDWDPDDGILIAKAKAILTVKRPKPKAAKEPKPKREQVDVKSPSAKVGV